MKQHADAMVSDVIYPLLCHSDEDERLWKDDPVEYIHAKYGECKFFLNINIDTHLTLTVGDTESKRVLNEKINSFLSLSNVDSVEEDTAVSCGEQLLNAMCKKRKGVLPKCLLLVTQVLNDPNSSPRQKDGALHMVGSIANILLKKDDYKDQFDDVLIRFVFPCMTAPFPFLRYFSFNRVKVSCVFYCF